MTAVHAYEEITTCRIIQRVNRFAVRVRDQGGAEHLAHLTNSGRLHDLIFPGNACLCVPRVSAKTTMRLIAAASGQDMVLIDPAEQSRAFVRTAAMSLIPWLDGWSLDRSEVTVGDSRIDFGIKSGDDGGFLELKSAAMLLSGFEGSFPDCPTTRGRKHLGVMRRLAARNRCVILFVVTHPGARLFRPNTQGDPVFCKDLAVAADDGLEVRAVKICIDGVGRIRLENPDLPCVIR